jgi:hypothetical protein
MRKTFYEKDKERINKLNFEFQGDNLIALALMILIGIDVLKREGCLELLDNLNEPND